MRGPGTRGRFATLLRWTAAATTLVVAAGVLSSAYLLRDPEPYFLARRSTLANVDTTASRLDGGVREQDITVRGANGFTVHLTVRRPAVEDTLPRRLFFILGGQQRGRAAGRLIGDTYGYVFASLEYPFEGNDRAKGLALVGELPAIRRALYDTPPAVLLALDYLLTRPDVDPARVELLGASFGAPFAVIAAALDPRVSRLWIPHGGGEPYTLIAHNLRKEIPFAPARAAVAGIASIVASGPRLAPERWVGRVAPRPVILLNASEDEMIPRRSVEALWAATREPREQIWLPGQHMRGSRPEVLQRLVDAVMARAEATPKPD